MHIDWTNFTPWSALAGGLLIGLASILFALLLGRIAGVSNIVRGLLRPQKGDVGWRVAFAGGLVAAPLVHSIIAPPGPVQIDASAPLLVAAGLLVGIGTSYGSGCTSGHGVCGLSRLSPRSLAATVAFMAAGFVTVFVLRHLVS